MSRNIWIGIVVVIVLVAGAWWYLNYSSTPTTPVTTSVSTEQTTQQITQTQQQTNSQPVQNTTTQTQPAVSSTQSSNTTPSATIDQSTLATNSPTPTLMGTVANTSSICVVLLNTKAGNLIANYNSYSNKWSLCTDTQAPEGGGAGITISNGHWSMNTAFTRGTTFGNGSYNVGVYNESTGQLLTTGVLTVSGVSDQ